MGGKAQLVPTNLIAVLCLVLTACAIPAMAVLSLEVSEHQTIIPVNRSVTLIGSGQFPSSFVLGDQPGGGRITWLVDGQVIAEQQSVTRSQATGGYTMWIEILRNHKFIAYLEIGAMDATNNGEYSVQLKTGEVVHSTSQSLELAVEYQPSSEYPQCWVHSAGVDKRLVCKSERGSPLVSLQWMKDGDSLQQTVDDDGESFIEVYTTVSGLDAIRMGRYECSMTYKESSAGSCFLDRPNVWIPTSTSGLAVGEDLEVFCLASASDNPPMTTFRWEVNPNRHHTVGNIGAVLHISNITSRDNGTEIICEGQNAMGRSNSKARSVIILRPVQATTLLITFKMEQTETPNVVGRLARFECQTTPERELMWLFKGNYIDPLNLEDRFFVEGNLNNAFSVLGVTREDVSALVTCYVADNYQKRYVMNLTVAFSLTTSSPLTLPTETPNHKLSSTQMIAIGSHIVPAVSQTHRRPLSVTPKVDTSRSKEDSLFSNSQIMWYIIGGMMCIVLLGICCWVSLKAKSLMCDPQREAKSVVSPTSPTCQRNGEDFVVRVGVPGEVRPSPTAVQSLLTKEQLVEQEVQYQDLEDVSRQRQTNEYQRIINNDWIPPTQV